MTFVWGWGARWSQLKAINVIGMAMQNFNTKHVKLHRNAAEMRSDENIPSGDDHITANFNKNTLFSAMK